MKGEVRLLKNVLIVGVGSVFSKAAGLFLLPLYTSLLPPAAFGTADFLINTALLLLPIASFCAPEAVFRFLAGGEDTAHTLAAGRGLLALGLLLLLAAFPALLAVERLRSYLPLLLFYVLASLCRSYTSHILRARGEYLMFSIQQLFCTLTTLALTCLLLVVCAMGVYGYLLAICISDAITAFLLTLYLRASGVDPFVKAKNAPRGPMLRYAAPLIPTAMLWWVIGFFDRFLLLHYNGEAALGIYAAAGRLPAILSLAGSVFLEAWQYSAIHKSEQERAAFFAEVCGALQGLLLAGALVLILGARPLVAFALAKEFAQAAQLLPPLVLGAVFSVLSGFLGSVSVVRMHSLSSLLTAVVGAASNLLLGFLLLPRLGAMGAALATAGAYGVVFVTRALLVRRLLPFRQKNMRFLLSVILLCAVAFLAERGRVMLGTILGVLALLPFSADFLRCIRVILRDAFKFYKKRGNQS